MCRNTGRCWLYLYSLVMTVVRHNRRHRSPSGYGPSSSTGHHGGDIGAHSFRDAGEPIRPCPMRVLSGAFRSAAGCAPRYQCRFALPWRSPRPLVMYMPRSVVITVCGKGRAGRGIRAVAKAHSSPRRKLQAVAAACVLSGVHRPASFRKIAACLYVSHSTGGNPTDGCASPCSLYCAFPGSPPSAAVRRRRHLSS